MTTIDSHAIPPIVARIAGTDVAERVQAAFPAAVRRSLVPIRHKRSNDGKALRDY